MSELGNVVSEVSFLSNVNFVNYTNHAGYINVSQQKSLLINRLHKINLYSLNFLDLGNIFASLRLVVERTTSACVYIYIALQIDTLFLFWHIRSLDYFKTI
jgi:hypothetical protein